MAKKKCKPANSCEACMNLIPIGEGDHLCGEDYTKMVLEEYAPTDDYYWCCGKLWEEK